MITKAESDFAIMALNEAEQMLGATMLIVTQDEPPTPKARRMAQVMVAAGLYAKLEMSRQLPENYGVTFDSLVEQMRVQWEKGTWETAEIDLDAIVWPDGPEDYINVAEAAKVETVQ